MTTPADVLRQARRRDSTTKRARVLASLAELEQPVSRSPSPSSPATPASRPGWSTPTASANTSTPPKPASNAHQTRPFTQARR